MDAEDPFSSTDLGHLDMRHSQMPVMLRPPGPDSGSSPVPDSGAALPAPAMEVVRVEGAEELAAAERIVIAGFELARFLPYRPGEMFPMALLDQPGVAVYLALLDGEAAGACVSVVDEGLASYYWVGTLPERRSRGVARAVMLGSLPALTGLPVTLTASRLGRPLYEKLGFTVASPSTWWSRSR